MKKLWSNVHSPSAQVFGYKIYGSSLYPRWAKKLHNIIINLDRMVTYLKHRFYPSLRYDLIRTKLSYGYHDPDVRMLYGCMAILVEFFEESVSSGETLQRNMQTSEAFEVLLYWQIVRPEFFKGTGLSSENVSEFDDQMLARLIAVRQSLWV